TANHRMQEQLKAWDAEPADQRKPLRELLEGSEFKKQLAEVLPNNKSLKAQYDWWYGSEGKGGANQFVEKDKAPVAAARLTGGKDALTYTAFVPALMALGYLFLILYFRARGGYTAEVLVGHSAKDEKFTGGTEGPGEA